MVPEDEALGDKGPSVQLPNFIDKETEELINQIISKTSQLFGLQEWSSHQRMKTGRNRHRRFCGSYSRMKHRELHEEDSGLQAQHKEEDFTKKNLKSWEQKIADFFRLAVAEPAPKVEIQS